MTEEPVDDVAEQASETLAVPLAELRPALEAILMVADEPLDRVRLASVVGHPVEDVGTALVALSLPLAAAPTQAAPPAVPTAAPSYGYSTAAWGTPVHIEIYEPTIPLPATPQAELENGYTEVLADSSSSQGRSSYLWPGDPVGEGFKTIADQLGEHRSDLAWDSMPTRCALSSLTMVLQRVPCLHCAPDSQGCELSESKVRRHLAIVVLAARFLAVFHLLFR